jgi:ElaB/YqjD/DUF883 family membrane-anchored ribosome-binding protein
MAEETTRQEEAVRERIEQTRAHMGETIEEIADHLDPDHLKHEFKAGLREQVEETKQAVRGATIGKAERMMHDVERTASETGRTLMDTVLENPVPAAMATIGLGWLIAEARNPRSRRGQREYAIGGIASTAPGYVGAGGYTAPPMSRTEQARAGAALAGKRVQDQAEEATDRVRQAASDVADQARGSVDRVRRSASRAAGEAQDSAEQAWHDVEHRARQAQVQARQTARENPLAAGAALLALGFAAGMLLPETQQEREVMGPARDRLVDRAQAAAGQAGQTAKQVATEAAKGIAQQAKTTAKEAIKQATP